MKKNSYAVPLALIFSLFFIWAISSNLLPTMIRQLMKTFELSTFQASLTEVSYWSAYVLFPIPIAMFMKRYSYKAGVIVGLFLAASAGLLFFPAAAIQQYWVYLTIFFIIATGMCFLETAANPYVTVLGDPATAPRRLNLAQSFNGLGAFIAAMFLSKLVLSGDKEEGDIAGEKLIDFSLAFLLGRRIGTMLMVKFKPQNMLVVYSIINIFLCLIIAVAGGMVGLYAMLGVLFFMSIMYPTQFSLALKNLGSKTKSSSAFLVIAIGGNVILPPLTGKIMDSFSAFYHIAYLLPLVCFIFCAYYGWKGYKVID